MAEPRFAGLTVLLTGAAGGFGSLAARRFAAEGARLVLCDLDEGRLSQLADGLRGEGAAVKPRVGDVRDEATHAELVEVALEAYGRLDVAVNNAGLAHPLTPLTKLDAETFDAMMAVNARSVFLGMKHQLPPMVAASGGAIVNVASAAGLVGAGHLSAYAASKHAVVGLTRAAADEAARSGVRVNALCPSFAATRLYDGIADALATRRATARTEADAKIVSRVPMGRVASPDEVVEAMLFLASPQNAFMTGQALAVDGGLTAV